MGKISGFHPKYGLKLIYKAIDLFGKPFFYLNTTTFFCNVGIMYYLVTTIQLPYYVSAGVDGQVQNEMSAIARAPSSCKGFIGVVADVLPLFGKQKRNYNIIFIFVGVASFIALGCLPFSWVRQEPLIAGLIFFIINFCSAGCDLLVEAKYIELMNKNPTINSELLSYAWFCETCGQLVPSISIGIIADNTDVRLSFFIFFPLLLLPLPSLFFGGMIDDDVPRSKSNKIDFMKLKSQGYLLILTTIQASFAIGLLLATYWGGSTSNLIYIFITSVILLTMTFFMINKVTFLYIFFIFIWNALYLNIQGALEYFYVADPECVEDGPQFTFVVTSTLSPTLFTIAQFVAIFAFQVIFNDWSFRSAFLATTLLRIIASFADLSVVNRWNKSIGIPDSLMYLLGYSTFAQVAFILSSLLNSYMIAKLCPKDFEATMFAFIAGCKHFGVTVASYIGVFLMDAFKIQSVVIPEENIGCNFDNLHWLVIIGHLILPLVTIPLIYFTVPVINLNQLITDRYTSDFKLKPKANQQSQQFAQIMS